MENYLPKWQHAGIDYSGLFISFEGPEGCGKSTQISKVHEKLKNELKLSIADLTKEPGAQQEELLVKMRELVFFGGYKLKPTTELLYMLTDRNHHYDYLIDNLSLGKIVMTDRYIDSSMAYQGYAGDVNQNLIDCLNRFATNGLYPDITVLIDVDYDTGLKRQTGKKKDHFEGKPRSFHEKVRMGYFDIASKNSDRFIVVDGKQSIDQVTDAIMHDLQEHLAYKAYISRQVLPP